MEKITLKIRKEKTLYNDEETGWRVVSVSVPIEDSDRWTCPSGVTSLYRVTIYQI